MAGFSKDNDSEQNIGELVLEALLSSNIESITNLSFRENSSWFNHAGNADLLAELI